MKPASRIACQDDLEHFQLWRFKHVGLVNLKYFCQSHLSRISIPGMTDFGKKA